MNDVDTKMNISNSGITTSKRLTIFIPFNLSEKGGAPLLSGKQLVYLSLIHV